jgi:phage terminase small subunit
MEDGMNKTDCPTEWLTTAGRAELEKLSPVLIECGLMQARYAVAISLLCNALAEHQRFSKLAESAPRVQGWNPKMIFNLRDNASKRVLELCREFGITPASINGPVNPTKSKKRKTKCN